jgi:hypothetical protein
MSEHNVDVTLDNLEQARKQGWMVWPNHANPEPTYITEIEDELPSGGRRVHFHERDSKRLEPGASWPGNSSSYFRVM